MEDLKVIKSEKVVKRSFYFFVYVKEIKRWRVRASSLVTPSVVKSVVTSLSVKSGSDVTNDYAGIRFSSCLGPC